MPMNTVFLTNEANFLRKGEDSMQETIQIQNDVCCIEKVVNAISSTLEMTLPAGSTRSPSYVSNFKMVTAIEIIPF